MLITPRLLIPVLLVLSAAGSALADIRTDFEMDRDPEIHVPDPVKVFSARLKPLWMQALARPEADMQRMAADAIGRAHRFGFPAMDESIPALIGILTSPSSHPAARLAAARALVVLDSRESAAEMAASAEVYGSELRQVVEPALAAWGYAPQCTVWLLRLKTSGTRHRELMLAIRCLADAKDGSAVEPLLALMHDPRRPPAVRSEAARAAGLLQDRGLEAEARRLVPGDAKASLIDRLCAVRLIAAHSGEDGQRLLAQLAVDDEPAVAVIALRRLIEIDPHLVLPLAEGAMQSADAKVRQCGADAYGLVPDPERVASLARLLDDPHPGVRGAVRESLFALAQQSALEGPIRRAATDVLAGESWRGLEQAALLLTALDHKPAAGRLAALLDFPRPEIAVTAAWGLKKFAIPETLPAMLDKSRRNTDVRRKGPAPPGLDEQTAHLFEAFGRMKFAAAEPLLREYVPKDFKLGESSRSAAIWSLGLFHAGVPDEALASKLAERASDIFSMPPELIPIQTMSIVSIGRMRADSQVGVLRRLASPRILPTRLGLSLRWALVELTGEQIPEPDPPKYSKGGWFLESLDE